MSPEEMFDPIKHDPVNHPKHYTNHPSGVECIQVTEHMNFCLGNAVKYLWRAGDKGNLLEDLKKARWYIDREIQRLEANKPVGTWENVYRGQKQIDKAFKQEQFENCEGCHSHVCHITETCMRKVDDPH